MIKDCAYPMQPWIRSPFKGCPKDLEGYRPNWNLSKFVLTCTFEHTFKILKERWRIIMRSDDVLLQHMVHIGYYMYYPTWYVYN